MVVLKVEKTGYDVAYEPSTNKIDAVSIVHVQFRTLAVQPSREDVIMWSED